MVVRVRVLTLGIICLVVAVLGSPRGIRIGGGRFGGGGSRWGGGSQGRSFGWGRRNSAPSSSWGARSPSNSYPRQSWSQSGGVGGARGARGSLGGGGFVKPQAKPALGGGGFVKPKPMSQPSNFGRSQSTSAGHYSSPGGKSYGYRAPGYGTNWGTSFPGGVGRYGGGGISKKALGLGIGAGFLGGAALGMAGTMATYSVYHRYHEFQRMMYMNNPAYGRGWDNGYYNRNECLGGCPPNAHCEYGFCECNRGLTRSYGSCQRGQGNPRPQDFNPFAACSTTNNVCSSLDMNLVCNTNVTTSANEGRCECRKDMRWNSEAGECQIFIDVDCSDITYETAPSATVLTAVEKAKQDMADAAGCPRPNFFCADGATCVQEGKVCDGNSDCPQTEVGAGGEEEEGCPSGDGPQEEGTPSTPQPVSTSSPVTTIAPAALNRTQTKEESLSTSLLSKIDPTNATAAELKEAFCRDVDAFSFEFQEQPKAEVVTARASTQRVQRDERPSLLCAKVPRTACAVAYDSGSCSGGWQLTIPEGQIAFKFWSSYFAYRNDMDTVGVRDGCVFMGFSDSSFNGNSITIRANGWDRWVVFASDFQYRHMDEDIESVRCFCNR